MTMVETEHVEMRCFGRAVGVVLFVSDSIDPGLHEALFTKQGRNFPQAFLLP